MINLRRNYIITLLCILYLSFFIPIMGQENLGDRISAEEVRQLRNEVKELRKKVKEIEQKQTLRRENETIERYSLDEEERESIIAEVFRRFQHSYGEPTSEEKSLKTLYDDGYVFKGKDDFLKIGGFIQADARFFESDYGTDNTFTVRRARVDFRGALEYDFGYRVMIEVAGNNAKLQEGWVSYDRFPEMRFRIGQFKEPFSLESLTSARWTDFIERSIIVTEFQPAEDIGAMVFGKLFGGYLTYAIAAFNGRGKNANDNNDDKDIAARLEFNPFAKYDKDSFVNLWFGGSFTFGYQDEDISGDDFKTAGKTAFLEFVNGVNFDGQFTRYGFDTEILLGPASVKAEVLVARQEEINRNGVNFNADFFGWYVIATYNLTGEKKPRNKPVKAEENFNPVSEEWGWGAWEVVARFEQFYAEQDLINKGFAINTNQVDVLSFGLNWWPNKHIKISFNYIYNMFDEAVVVDGENEGDEHSFLMRFQANF